MCAREGGGYEVGGGGKLQTLVYDILPLRKVPENGARSVCVCVWGGGGGGPAASSYLVRDNYETCWIMCVILVQHFEPQGRRFTSFPYYYY